MTDEKDNKLSDFTDRVLEGKMNQPASNQTDDLRGLEETVLRLNKSQSTSELDEAAKKQMWVRLNARVRREGAEPKQKKSFWESLFENEWMRTQTGLQYMATIGVIATLAAVAIVVTGTTNGGDTNVGTAINTLLSFPQNIIFAGILIGLIFLLLNNRRKK